MLTSSAWRWWLFRLGVRSDIKVFGSKCFMHLILGLNCWWVRWLRWKFTITGKSQRYQNVIPALFILCSSQIFVYVWSSKEDIQFFLNFVGLWIREMQPQIVRQSTKFVTIDHSWYLGKLKALDSFMSFSTKQCKN